MHATSRNKVFAAIAAVGLIAGFGLWAQAAEEPRPDDGSGSSSSPTSTGAGETPAAQASPGTATGDGSKGKKGKKGKKGGDGSSGKDEAEAPTTDPTTDPSPDGGDRDGDESGEQPENETPATPGTGETVKVVPVQTEAPVPLDSVGDFGTGLTVRLANVTSVQAEAKAPGEIAGPGVRVIVEAVNDGDGPVSLDGVVVFLSYGGDRAPASQFGSSSDPLGGDLASGGSRTGSYVYAVPPDGRRDVRVEISYTGSAPTVAFEGSVDG